MHIQLTKYKIFLCTPCIPHQGLALWTTTLGLLPSLTVASAPHVENHPNPIAKQLECISQNEEVVLKPWFQLQWCVKKMKVVDRFSSTSVVTGGRKATERTEGAGIFFQRGSQIYKKSALIKLRPPYFGNKHFMTRHHRYTLPPKQAKNCIEISLFGQNKHTTPWGGYSVERWVRGCAAQIGCIFSPTGFSMTPFYFKTRF